MAPKKITFGAAARKAVLGGAKELEAAVATTLGPKGRTVLIYDGTSNLRTTKDGVSVARAIGFKDQHKNVGAKVVQEAANKTNTVAGDGTTTATILTVGLMEAGDELVNLGINATDVKKGFDLALADATKLLVDYVVPVRSEADIAAVASVSSNADDEIVKNVVDAFVGIGEGGVVSITDSFSRSGKTSVVFSDGLEFDRGFLSSICVNTASETFEAEDPRFLLFESPVREYSILAGFVAWAKENSVPLVVIAPTYEDDVIGAFYENVDKGTIRGTLVMTPGYAKSTIDEWTKDIAVQVNAKVVKDQNEPVDFGTTLGSAGYVQVKKEKTTITDPKCDEEALAKRIAGLKEEVKSDEKTELELTSIKERLAKMTGGIATIKIGANSEFELKEKKDRYEDAVNAVRAAITGGISPGGGTPLMRVQKKLLKSVKKLPPSVAAGYEAFAKVLTRPAELLVSSTGKNPYEVISKVLAKPAEYGYDARKEKVCDLLANGVVDPSLVIVSALKYACSVAGTFVTTDCTVVNDVEALAIEPVDEIMERS